MTNLTEVLEFVSTASTVERNAIYFALTVACDGMLPSSPHDPPLNTTLPPMIPNRVAKAAATLSKIEEGNLVTFPYDGVIYTGKVNKINKMTAVVAITRVNGTSNHARTRPISVRPLSVGQIIKVGAGILARSL